MSENGDIWTSGRILKWTEQYFGGKGVESPRLDAEVLLSHVLKKERIYLYVHFDQPMEAEELAAYKELIKQRVNHVPVAYLLGQKEFMGLTFKVTPATLIPRPDTEILVQAAVARLRSREQCSFADIGTGSGAICLSVLNFVPVLGLLNRLLGGLLGMVKYSLVLGALIWLFESTNLIKEETMQKSKLARPIKALPELLYNYCNPQKTT